MFEEIIINDRSIIKYNKDKAEYLLIQFVDDSDEEGLEEEINCIKKESRANFAFAGIRTTDWNNELSPWEAEPVFGRQGFGGNGAKSLDYLKNNIESIIKEFEMEDGAKIILGGYSLAGLFALWAGYETDIFYGIAAASPSVWFDGWADYTAGKDINVHSVYLSMGDEEAKAKNKKLAEVEKCIKMQYNEFSKQKHLRHILEWNQGNHFKDTALRMAKGFIWNLDNI